MRLILLVALALISAYGLTLPQAEESNTLFDALVAIFLIIAVLAFIIYSRKEKAKEDDGNGIKKGRNT